MRIGTLAVLALMASASVQAAPPAAPLKAVLAQYDRVDAVPGDAAPGGVLTLPDQSTAAVARRRSALDAVKHRIERLSGTRLSRQDRLTLRLLDWAVDEQLGVIRFDEARLPFNSDSGFDVEPIYYAGSANLKTPADLAAWLKLLDDMPAYYATGIANARRGIATRFTQPTVTIEQVLVRARATAAMPIDQDPLLGPIARSDLPQATKDAALRSARQIILARVRPAENGFVAFLEKEYLPAARPSLAVTSLPDGQRYYAWLVRRYTTTVLSPDAIFDLGTREVARIRGEMQAVMRDAHFDGDLKSFIGFLRTDPQFYATSREELLEKASRIAKEIDYQLPAHFATLPRLTYGVLPVPAAIEEGYTTGRYFPGDAENGVPGGLMINTSHLDQRPLYELPALELHEGVPGHHLQIALAQEASYLPQFRRDAFYSAFGEGWALYSEWLGGELGMYRTPYERFGRLSYEMWRACRLIADTGIATRGWSIAQAKQCLLDNTALSPHNIDTEVQRYVSWPGQALSYKVGEITIKRLRANAEAKLGTCFDERQFHDALLRGGSMPLAILEEEMARWQTGQRVGQVGQACPDRG